MKRELIEIGTTVRVENGPARKTAVATAELLDDAVTASHYFARQVRPARYEIDEEGNPGALISPAETIPGGKDAMGKEIILGEPMTYLDYRGEWVWYVYQLKPDKTHIDGERWLPAGVETTKERALTAAKLLED